MKNEQTRFKGTTMLRDFDIEHEHLDLSCFQQPIVLIDLETTGFKPDRDRVIEIAALRLERGSKPRAFSTLIEHGQLSTGSAYIHGIYRDMLRGAPLFKDIICILKEMCQGALMVAHNALLELAHKFDLFVLTFTYVMGF